VSGLLFALLTACAAEPDVTAPDTDFAVEVLDDGAILFNKQQPGVAEAARSADDDIMGGQDPDDDVGVARLRDADRVCGNWSSIYIVHPN
jgi:hypothetical protein